MDRRLSKSIDKFYAYQNLRKLLSKLTILDG
jgi:hypothetical protein